MRAVLLDRDGVVSEPVWDPVQGAAESPLRPEDVHLVDGVADALRALRAQDWLLAVVSNQPAAAKGRVPLAQLQATDARVRELLVAEGLAPLDAWTLCLHRREDDCACRKPEPGMLLDTAAALRLDLAACWMAGDASTDIAAGRAAGCRTALIEHPATTHRRDPKPVVDLVVGDLTGLTVALAGLP